MHAIKFKVKCEVKQVGNKFYYWHYLNGGRWMPVKKADVIFS